MRTSRSVTTHELRAHGTLPREHQPTARGSGMGRWILALPGSSFLEDSPTTEAILSGQNQMNSKTRPRRKRPRSNCAFCGITFTTANDSKEHIIPNAIGGRRTVTRFVCKSCNAKSGSNWDSALADQFKPICTLLNIDRHRGNVPSLRVQTIGGDTLQLHADGRATSPHPKVTETRIDNQVSIQVTAPSMTEFTRTLRRLADKYPQIDVDKALRDARTTRKFIRDPWMIKVEGRPEAERSIVKSLVAMAAYHGIDIENLEHAREYLLSDGSPCFGWLNDVDIVVNRPPERFFHCVFIRGDPENKQILGYVEYFGYQRFVACLSSNYNGDPIDCGYAIDPVTGEELALRVELAIPPEEIQAIHRNERFSHSVLRDALNRLLAHWSKKDIDRAMSDAIQDAVEHVFSVSDVSESESVSDEEAWVLSKRFGERIRPALEHLVLGRRFTPDQMERIFQTIRDEEGDEN